MAGSSMRNSVHRRNHKERAQPLARTKLGLLEKHKDYVQRARDYHSKRDRLKKLKEKVAFRNKDEFYWGMVKGRTEGGVHVQSRGNESLPNEVVRLLKTQDVGYVRTQIAADESKIAALKNNLHSLTSLIKQPTSSSNTGASSSFSDDDDDSSSDLEGLDLQQLVAAGVISPEMAGADESTKGAKKGKGKGKVGKSEVPSKGHVVFADGKEEMMSYERPTSPLRESPEAGPSRLPATTASAPDLELGWVLPKKKSKKARISTSTSNISISDLDLPSDLSDLQLAELEIQQDQQERLLLKEAKLHRKSLLAELSARLDRLATLQGTLAHMEVERNLMRKSSAVVKREKEMVEQEEDDHEGGEGGGPRRKVEWRPKVVKWKAERRR